MPTAYTVQAVTITTLSVGFLLLGCYVQHRSVQEIEKYMKRTIAKRVDTEVEKRCSALGIKVSDLKSANVPRVS